MLCNTPTALRWFNGKTCQREGFGPVNTGRRGGAVVSAICVYLCQELVKERAADISTVMTLCAVTDEISHVQINRNNLQSGGTT